MSRWAIQRRGGIARLSGQGCGLAARHPRARRGPMRAPARRSVTFAAQPAAGASRLRLARSCAWAQNGPLTLVTLELRAMPLPSARRALTDSALALVAACVAIAMFLPPMVHATTASVPRIVFTGLAIALALPLHLVLLGMAARRLGRSVAGWVGLSLLLFPVGGAAALVLLAGVLEERQPEPALR